MTSPRHLTTAVEQLQGGLILLTLVGSTLAFGGAVWWARPALALLLLGLVLAGVVRATLTGSFLFLKSPLGLVGGLALALAVAQLAPLPARLARFVTPRSHGAHALGVLPSRALADDPTVALPDAGAVRTPATLDRSATLRWLAGAAACLALFGAVAHYADRLSHSMVVWGGVVGSLFCCTGFLLAQLLGGTDGLYGLLEPGQGSGWGPSTIGLLESPNVTVLRGLDDTVDSSASWAVTRPGHPAPVAGFLSGPGSFLALGSLGLPLGLAIILQLLAPRGAREPLVVRMRASGRGGLTAFLFVMLLLSAVMIGAQGGRVLCVPFALGLLVTGLPAARASGLRGVAIAATALTVAALIGGVVLGGRYQGPDVLAPVADRGGWPETRAVWGETARIARDFPILGAGLGSFGSVHPYYKASDASPTTALSSLLQWWAETGVAGLALLTLAGAWFVVRLPGAIRRVGTADRCLAFGLLGTLVCFGLFSLLHWTVEVAAVALAASAVAGTFHRWLAGGTDLFVERAG